MPNSSPPTLRLEHPITFSHERNGYGKITEGWKPETRTETGKEICILSESNLKDNSDENAGNSLKDSGKKTKGTDKEVAATGPGATGKLLGTTESARQEPWIPSW